MPGNGQPFAAKRDLGVWVSSLGAEVSSLGVWVSSLGAEVSSLGVWVSSLGVWVSSLGVWVSSLGADGRGRAAASPSFLAISILLS
jgi:hypothetical protein